MPIGTQKDIKILKMKKMKLNAIRIILIIVIIIVFVKLYNSTELTGDTISNFLCVKTETEKILEHPEQMTSEQREMAAYWGSGGKAKCIKIVEEFEVRLNERKSGGYVWGEHSERRVRNALANLNKAIDMDDFLILDKKIREVEESIRLFESGCRWQKGMCHPKYSHVYSSSNEGFWDAEPGWVFISNDSLEVARICSRCDGNKVEVERVRCGGCNGRGKVPAPMDGIFKGIDDGIKLIGAIDDIVKSFEGKKTKNRRSRSSYKQDMIDCPTCNRTGKVDVEVICTYCSGNGWCK